MFNCHYYWLFAPHRGGIVDDGSQQAAFDINIVTEDKKSHSLGLFCDQEGLPHFARLTIDGLDQEKIPEKLLPTLQAIKEHMLVVLRFTYRPDVILAEPGVVWTFTKGEAPVNINFSITDCGRDLFNPESTKNLFVHSFAMREMFRLYADGEDRHIPLQYRFLSFYKLLELRYKEHGVWKHKGIDDLLSHFAEEFAAVGYTRKPFVVINDLRDRCAHIRTGKSKEREVMGVTHLNHAAAVKVWNLLPVMRAVCATVINECADGKLLLGTEIIKDDLQFTPEE